MNRFTERLENGRARVKTIDYGEHPYPIVTNDFIEKLAAYEDLEEQGKLVLYPTYAYCIIGNEVRKGFVFEVTYCVCRKPLYIVRYDDNSLDKHTGYLGISVFLTKEEAEEKLKELLS